MLVGTQSGKIDTVIARSSVFTGSVTLALGLLGASPALAQSCGELKLSAPPGSQNLNFFGPYLATSSTTGLSGGLAISSAMTAAHTAFLSQGTAFVGSPANPKPDSEGSGIRIRGVGGELMVNSNASVRISASTPASGPAPAETGAGSTTCITKLEQTFGGFQLGHDVARLNVGGWNLTLGTTAGYLETAGHIVGGNILAGQTIGNTVVDGAFNSITQAPFVGTYGVATYGNFSVDGLLQYDYFQTTLNSPSAELFNQKLGAHGFTAAASARYNWQIPNSNWFIEPGAGIAWSRETVDPLNTASPLFLPVVAANIGGTTQISTIESVSGRVGVRVGTTIETANAVYQPFAAASVWHDFGSRLTANYGACPGCSFRNDNVSRVSADLSANNIGTFGQYSLGVSGQIKDTGWLGFARVDYREGSEIRGISGSGGIRYQFTPTEAAGVMPVRGQAPAEYPANWTGWYAGGFGGAQLGHGSMAFPGLSSVELNPAGFLGGGTFGYNYQAGRWLLGIEGDFAGTNTNGSAPCAPLAAGWDGPGGAISLSPLFQMTCHDDLNWVATATARFGYAWTPRALLYFKAGGAWAAEELSLTCNLGPVPGFPGNENCTNAARVENPPGASVRNTRVGWTVGYGTEFALTDRWSIKGEFDWLDFGTKALTLSDGTSVNSSLRTAQGKIGVNYKLSGP